MGWGHPGVLLGDPLGARRRGNGWTGRHMVECLPTWVLRRADGRVQVWVRARLRAQLDDGVAVVFVVNNDEGVEMGGPRQGVWWGRARAWAG